MLLNRARATALMERDGLDGLIAVSPINIYYLSNYWGPLMRMRRQFYNYAVLPRDPAAPAALILSGVENTRLFHRPDATWMPNRMPYLHPVYQDRRDFDPDVEDPEAIEYAMKWPISHDTLGPRDKDLIAFVEQGRGKGSVNALYALKKGLIEAGLDRGKIGSDDPRIGAWLHEIGMRRIQVAEGTTLFREIRMVKTPDEIALMRKAASINEEALELTIASLEVGMPRDELERIFNREVAIRGSRGIYLATGQAGSNNAAGRVIADESITFDALSEFANYHGDLGRVAVCGTPPPELVRRMDAIAVGCRAVMENVKPGVTGRELSQVVIDAVRSAGFPGFFFATPHSIGLEHSDHKLPLGAVLPGGNGPFIFEENMTFSLDMPYYEIGWGNIHMEDQFLVTADGVECITSGDTSIRIRPGA